MSYGFRVGAERLRVEKTLIAAFSNIPVANVSDAMWRMSGGGASMRPYSNKVALAGPALTVRVPSGDNLMVHKAIELAMPGDVIVVDAGGNLSNAIIGEHMIGHAVNKGVVGFVIYGAVRDLEHIRTSDLVVFAAGVTHRGPYKNGPGEINYPIAIDGLVIESGDLILGDADGFVAIPLRDAEAVLSRAQAKNDAERRKAADIETNSDDRTWIDRDLRRLGCVFAQE